MSIRTVIIVAGILVSGCTNTVTSVEPITATPSEPGAIFYLSSEPTPEPPDARAAAALATAERSALEFGQPNVAYPWATSASTGGSVRASEPFRIAGRDCRRLNYENAGGGAAISRSQVTVCRRPGQPWAPVV